MQLKQDVGVIQLAQGTVQVIHIVPLWNVCAGHYV